MHNREVFTLASALGTFVGCVSATQALTMDFVTVGDAGNTADDTGYGALANEYQIGKYEVTNGQYIEFLNAVAANDIHDLFSPGMDGSPYGGIERNGSPGSYYYGPKGGDTNWLSKPVNYVSFWDACRFANWLHNGQPSGTQDTTTTEDGAYTLGGVTNPSNTSITRNPNAKVFIPNADEWYKAAYYKSASTNAGYWDYAMGTNDTPDSNAPASDTGDSANYFDTDYVLGEPYYTSDVGAYLLSDSPYGTFDQNGNVWEWTEETILSSYRAARGGSFFADASCMHASHEADRLPDENVHDIGFRVAMVPEPATLSLLVFGGLAVLRRRR
jgi:sulfatase modifying factor 1